MTWLAIILCGFFTFLIRFIPLSGIIPKKLYPNIKSSLQYIPLVVLTGQVPTFMIGNDALLLLYFTKDQHGQTGTDAGLSLYQSVRTVTPNDTSLAGGTVGRDFSCFEWAPLPPPNASARTR